MMPTNTNATAQEIKPFLSVVAFTLGPPGAAPEQSRCHPSPRRAVFVLQGVMGSAWTDLCKTLHRTYLEAFQLMCSPSIVARRGLPGAAGDRRWPPRDLGRAGRRVPGGEGAAEARSRLPRARLGANGGVLPVPARALEASADLKPGGVENATAVTWKTLRIAERTFRRLDAPELLADVARRGRVCQRRTCDEPPARRRPPPDLIYTLLL